MSKVLDIARSLADSARNILAGEPARAIGYGGAAVVYLVARASGSIPDVTVEEALVQATAAIAIVAALVESVRRVVYSPNTVDAIIDELIVERGDTT